MPQDFPNMLLSHIELFVQNLSQMEAFYTDRLGFLVTDRGEGENGMVFLSRNPNEHHQIVLNPRPSNKTQESPVDHISFRVETISDLRVFYRALNLDGKVTLHTVSHGTAWSIYFKDPEGNRFEIFTDTPWHVNQPCKFEVDFETTDRELLLFTENTIKNLPGFKAAEDWKKSHQAALN